LDLPCVGWDHKVISGGEVDTVGLIRTFAAHPLFQSARVEELELDGDFYRRPLRPEDLEFIDFSEPIRAETVCNLAALAAHRILRCIYDLDIAQIPPDGNPLKGFASFHSDQNRILAAQICPFLECFAFGFAVGDGEHETSEEACTEGFARIAREATGAADAVAQQFAVGGLSERHFRFVLIQKWCLASSKHSALARAAAAGYFETVAPQLWPRVDAARDESELLSSVAAAFGVDGRSHTYWQFYLPTSLAEANFLSAVASRPERRLWLLGAAFVAEAELHSLARAATSISRRLGGAPTDGRGTPDDLVDDMKARFAGAVRQIAARFGMLGLQEIGRSLRAAERVVAAARRDLDEQLRWVAGINKYVDFARRLDARIKTEDPDVDRETFIEPREMCSTTHVHDDHRLVVIESGQMVFWCNVGMRWRMKPGDMLLVPQGRLHGSSVESESCTYHQPIIPEKWIRTLVREENALCDSLLTAND
jgi:hypothetical protein